MTRLGLPSPHREKSSPIFRFAWLWCFQNGLWTKRPLETKRHDVCRCFHAEQRWRIRPPKLRTVRSGLNLFFLRHLRRLMLDIGSMNVENLLGFERIGSAPRTMLKIVVRKHSGPRKTTLEVRILHRLFSSKISRIVYKPGMKMDTMQTRRASPQAKRSLTRQKLVLALFRYHHRTLFDKSGWTGYRLGSFCYVSGHFPAFWG